MPDATRAPRSGGTIPLLDALQTASPRAEFILWSAEDIARSRIHFVRRASTRPRFKRTILARPCSLRELGVARA
ncbi:MAG: hypothetical protein ABWZ53_06910 [Actinomycetota bacterium]